MKKTISIAAAVAVLLGAGSLLAHHGGNLYDTAKPVVLKDARITKFEWGTPHNQILLRCKE